MNVHVHSSAADAGSHSHTSFSSSLLRLGWVVGVVSFLFLTGCWTAEPTDFSTQSQAHTTTPRSIHGWHHRLVSLVAKTSPTGNTNFYKLPRSWKYRRIPQDRRNPLNRWKVRLGSLLYHETALAQNPKKSIGKHTYSCASCHHAAAGFQAGIRQGIGEGGVGTGLHGKGRNPHKAYAPGELDVQPVRSPSALNGAWQNSMLWNGQLGASKANKGTRALWKKGGPLEFNRLGFAGLEIQAIVGQSAHRLAPGFDSNARREPYPILKHPRYRRLFRKAFPRKLRIPKRFEHRRTQIKVGLAIAAYERTLLANRAPFQRWLRGNRRAMNVQQYRGAMLFFGKAKCASCHTGPALSSVGRTKFYALGMGDMEGSKVVSTALDMAVRKGRGGFTGKAADNFRFKIPQLYNLKNSPFFGHGGTFRSIREVIVYKNKAISQNSHVPDSQLDPGFKPLGLTSKEINDLTAFVKEALFDPALQRFVPRRLPSKDCRSLSNYDSWLCVVRARRHRGFAPTLLPQSLWKPLFLTR
jgi:cytochrome c peroxidase